MKKKSAAKKSPVKKAKSSFALSSQSDSPSYIIQFGVVVIIIAAIVLAYVVGTMNGYSLK